MVMNKQCSTRLDFVWVRQTLEGENGIEDHFYYCISLILNMNLREITGLFDFKATF